MAKRAPLTIRKGLSVSYSGPRLSKLPADTLSFVFLAFNAFRTVQKAHVIIGQHHYYHIASFCAAVLSTVARRPLVIRVHDFGGGFRKPSNTSEFVFMSIMKWLTWLSFKRAEQVLVPGEELIDIVRGVYGSRTIPVRPSLNGVDTTYFNPRRRSDELRRRIGSRHIVVFSGSIDLGSDASGLDILVRATKLLRVNIPDLRVLILGDGPDLPYLVQLADSLRLHDSLQFLGWVSHELIPVYLASADVGVGPLRATAETIGSTPVKVVEYMASGCVVVVGRGGTSESLVVDGVNGIVVESVDAAGVAKGVMRAFFDEEVAERLRSKARETAEKVYDWEVIVSKLDDVLRSVVELRKRRSYARG
jgi:glycosyltransferase involved in cell wall biosynthesis